ncbi:MAG: serine protease AprX [Solirubrobacterales bacterium]|nr:serine protease AprX [Solirubrobacterales bacterium]
MPAPRLRPALDKEAAIIGAPTWWNAGFTGGTGPADASPIDVADGPVEPTHPAFHNVTVDNQPGIDPAAFKGHETHTGGIIAADQTYLGKHYLGIAYGIDHLNGGDVAFSLGIPTRSPHATDPAEIFNNSSSCPSADYEFCRHDQTNFVPPVFNVSWAQSAGNDGPGQGSIGEAEKNDLIVGGTDTKGTVDPSDDQVGQYSARGPTTSGIKQPDIVAPMGAYSPTQSWNRTPVDVLQNGGECGPVDNDGTCADFTDFSGTSASAPMAAGGLALLAGSGVNDEKAQRAILIDSAKRMAGETRVGWNPDSGWGALDLTTAFVQRGYYATGGVRGGEASLFRVNAPADSKATLVWDTRGFTPENDPGNPVAYTTTNLDLHQYRASNNSEIMPPPDPGYGAGPDALDLNDTVEQVRSPGDEGTQQILYKVKAASTVEGADAEPFAIAAGAPLTNLQEPEAKPTDVSVENDPSVCGDPVTIQAKLANSSSDYDAAQASVAFSVPAGVTLSSGDATQTVAGGTLAKGQTSEAHSWTVSLDSPGTKTVTITGEAHAEGETWHYAHDVALKCDDPTSLEFASASAAPTAVDCGTDIAVSATLTNPSATFSAGEAKVGLALDSGVQLVSGLASQTVSGGLLDAGQTSESHSWTVRPTISGDHTITLQSEATTQPGTSHSRLQTRSEQLTISCSVPPGPQPAMLTVTRPGLTSGRLIARGAVANASSGEVSIVARWVSALPGTVDRSGARKLTSTAQVGFDGRFYRPLKICRAGHWQVRAKFPGDDSLLPASAEGPRLAVRPSQLHC